MSAGGDGADGEKGEAMAQWWKKRSKSNDDSDDDDMEYMHGPRPRLLMPRRAVPSTTRDSGSSIKVMMVDFSKPDTKLDF